MIAPLEQELQAAGINTIVFSMDNGLRSLPVAALHDGKQFLVGKVLSRSHPQRQFDRYPLPIPQRCPSSSDGGK
jgi:CHAT domain-containing protein